MAKSFVYNRFDIVPSGNEIPDAEGEWVKAQDALDREAVLQAKIRTLEVQLKDLKEGEA
ncbi:hypothetical protein [Paraburkholderia sp. BL10I2N1]|uniref:hypothetical protein n=1 Tax=Paraburkholderia sp. BL10I2N1 TaxID=1938796 RepID=UPI0010EFE84D|nr:hypothetical protein [Paraburkholderia sp. BL10I2N1]TDN70444.1 hypothetical protein B0G77_3918 [Paraburkholderia sp. BL10I2N1]